MIAKKHRARAKQFVFRFQKIKQGQSCVVPPFYNWNLKFNTSSRNFWCREQIREEFKQNASIPVMFLGGAGRLKT